MENLFSDLPDNLSEEVVEILSAGKHTRIERIISNGHCSEPGFWYDQPENEWVILLQGAAQLEFADNRKIVSMTPGDYLEISAHRRHRVVSTSETETTVWLAVHYG